MAKFMIYEEKRKEERLFLKLNHSNMPGVNLDIVDEDGVFVSHILFIGENGITRIAGINESAAKVVGIPLLGATNKVRMSGG